MGKICFAQVQDKLLLSRITTRQGLTSNEVKCIFQDSRGFIWIGTYDGLNRYDGRNIKTYRRNITDTNSLINSWVNSIVEDKDGNLWIGTFAGVSKLNVASGKFTNYRPSQLFPGQTCLAGEQCVFKDHNGTIWVTSGGLSYYQPGIGNFVAQPFIPPSPVHGFTKNQLVISVQIDRDNNFWMGTMDGLYKYNIISKKYSRYSDDPSDNEHMQNGDLLASLDLVNDTTILAAAWQGKIFAFSTTKKITQQQYTIPIKGKVDIRISTVNWDGKKEYWAAHNKGIVILDEHFNILNEWPSSISQTAADSLPPSINNVFQSKEGIVFIGSANGVVVINPYLQVFKTYYFTPRKDWVGEDAGHISSIRFRGDTLVASSIYSNALYMFDADWKLLKTIPWLNAGGEGIENSSVYDVEKENDSVWWATTFHGLVKFNPVTLHYSVYTPNPNDTLFFRHNRFMIVRVGKDNKIWLANYKQDVMCFDRNTRTFKLYQPFGRQTSIWGLLVTKNNDVWFASGNSLGRYNPAKDKFDIFNNSNAKDAGFGNLIEGKEGELWLASDNGIWRYDVQQNKLRNWNTADGLCNNYTDKILFDRKGRLWITTNDGISAFDTTQKIFYNFTGSEGLPSDNWNGALAINSKGIVYLGNSNFITFFNPAVAIRQSRSYPSYITGCEVNGSNYALPPGKSSIKKISLNYNENNLNFQFTVVNLLQPFQTSYYYKLENFDKDWHLSPSGTINYTNLDAGKYILRVSSNPASSNTGGNDVLYITINSPFWKTWWFITGALFVAVASVTYGVRLRINHIRTEANRKSAISQQLADLRMKALRSQMNPHFLFNSLNAIQECCLTGQVDAATQYLARFSKLVRYILENSSKQWISLQEEIEILKLYLDVESLRFTGSFSYHIENTTRLNAGLIKIPPMLVQPFAENAIWHGLMQKNGERQLWIRFYNDEERLFIEVEDNGVGRSNAGDNGHKSMGMGIVRERMKLVEETQKFPAVMEIIDKKDDGGNASGTLIKLTLPII